MKRALRPPRIQWLLSGAAFPLLALVGHSPHAAAAEPLAEAAAFSLSPADLYAAASAVPTPADAVVIEKLVVQGARFEAGETILRLADLSTVWVIAKVPAAQAAGIEPGQPARFETVALPGRVIEGEVTFVQPVIDAATRTVDVRVALRNPDGDLRPGLYGTVVLDDPGAGPVLSVPRSAVLDSGTR